MPDEKVSRLYSSKPVSEHVEFAVQRFSGSIAEAIRVAKEAGTPQGLISAILHTYSLEETQRLLSMKKGE
jgi:hypothetical protein